MTFDIIKNGKILSGKSSDTVIGVEFAICDENGNNIATEVKTAQDTADAKYTKPSTGIPSTDLTSDLQTQIGNISNKLNTSGGTITGAISRDSGGSWITGRDNAVIKQIRTSNEGNDWHPAVSIKTSVGNWTFGSVGGESLSLSYDTDANYSAGTNKSAVINFPSAGSTGTIALTSDIHSGQILSGTSTPSGTPSGSIYPTLYIETTNYILYVCISGSTWTPLGAVYK